MKRKKSPNQKPFVIVQKTVRVTAPAEPPAPAVDTAKAVAFAMSIAEEMKLKNRDAESSRALRPFGVNTTDSGSYSGEDLFRFKDALVAAREDAVAKSMLAKDAVALNDDQEIESDGCDGSNQTMHFDALNCIGSVHRLIQDIDEALQRIEDGTYGVCVSCSAQIPRERLSLNPFAKTCTACQQRIETQERVG